MFVAMEVCYLGVLIAGYIIFLMSYSHSSTTEKGTIENSKMLVVNIVRGVSQNRLPSWK